MKELSLNVLDIAMNSVKAKATLIKIHIFEDEIRLKYDIVKSRILNIIGKTTNTIYARQ